MKKVSKILLTVGGIFHIVNGISLLISSLTLIILAVVFFVTGNLYGPDFVNGEVSEEYVQLSMNIAAILYLFLSVMLIGLGIVSFIASKITFKAGESGDKKSLIAAIVFGLILDAKVAAVGGIFGLIASNKDDDKKQASDNEPAVAEEVVK